MKRTFNLICASDNYNNYVKTIIKVSFITNFKCYELNERESKEKINKRIDNLIDYLRQYYSYSEIKKVKK